LSTLHAPGLGQIAVHRGGAGVLLGHTLRHAANLAGRCNEYNSDGLCCLFSQV